MRAICILWGEGALTFLGTTDRVKFYIQIFVFCDNAEVMTRQQFSIRLSVLDSVVVSIPACHAGDRGSIPRRGAIFIIIINLLVILPHKNYFLFNTFNIGTSIYGKIRLNTANYGYCANLCQFICKYIHCYF